MNVKQDKIEKNKVKLTIEVDAKKFEEGMQKAYIKNRKKFNIPGFRKGKAPRKLIETYYGEVVFYEDAINIICPEEYENAVLETKIEPVDRPEIDIEQIGNGENLIFTAEIFVKPEFELADYKGIEVEKVEYNVTEEQVEDSIKQMQEKNSRLVSVDDRPIQNGDIVQIDFEGFIDDEPFEGGKAEKYDLEIGSGQFIPGFEDGLIGKNKGEELDVNVDFPEDYNAESLAGKSAVFKVKIHEIKFKELPELDDEFAKDVSEFETLQDLKEDTTKKLKEEAERKTKSDTENAVIQKLVEVNEIDIPKVMIDNQVDNILRDFEMRMKMQGMNMDQYMQLTGLNAEQFKKQFEAQAISQVKSNLILEKISNTENIEISDEDIEKYFNNLAQNYNMELEKIKEMFKGEEQLDKVKDELKIEKAIELVVNNAMFVEKKKEEKEEKKDE